MLDLILLAGPVVNVCAAGGVNAGLLSERFVADMWMIRQARAYIIEPIQRNYSLPIF